MPLKLRDILNVAKITRSDKQSDFDLHPVDMLSDGDRCVDRAASIFSVVEEKIRP